jgi:hypothetical protein
MANGQEVSSPLGCTERKPPSTRPADRLAHGRPIDKFCVLTVHGEPILVLRTAASRSVGPAH